MDKLTIFIALTSVAILLQACVLLAMYLAMRKTTSELQALAGEVRTKVMPALDQAQQLIAEVRPKIEVIADNVRDASIAVKAQVQRIDATVNDVMDRARLQVIRADELLSRTLDKVEHTSDVVQKTVVSPVRQISGLMQGITVGLEFLFSRRARQNGGGRDVRRPVPQDEMFI
jgi:tetrahydromethanopterin S-methyltransferase subunit F